MLDYLKFVITMSIDDRLTYELWVSQCRMVGVTEEQCDKVYKMAFEYATTTTAPNSEVTRRIMRQFLEMVKLGLIRTDAPEKDIKIKLVV